jgi:hypothetical protein
VKRNETTSRELAPGRLAHRRTGVSLNDYGRGLWVIILLAVLALGIMAHQDGLTPTAAQEAMFHREQARRLTALGLTPVVTESVRDCETRPGACRPEIFCHTSD